MAKWDVDKLTCQKCKERSSEAADWRSQSDEVQAAVAAKLREAANIARASLDGEIAYDDILALITPDAQAALDRVVSARFGVVRSEVVRLSAEGKIDSEATERLLAAIRKGGE